ncbi:hypothetical protein HMPREF9370_0081 [Neisseria wadsworthii 9715]|uniref:Protoporphyrinogen IX oxidase n=2 Tax=Neisseria TaxID=482 RepID=G4CLX2_9NEIS|nr:hypothetical protein HMPREF9370_0081 [Neisseria wadsworthii 9715]
MRFSSNACLKMYLWFKFIHIFFIISWFAGLFYLPRIYVNLAMAAPESNEYERLMVMAEKLFKFMTPLGIGALLSGIIVPFTVNWWANGWVHAKTSIGFLLAVYHVYCWVLLRAFRTKANRHSHKWYRFFNEIPVILMIAALYLVVFKPF